MKYCAKFHITLFLVYLLLFGLLGLNCDKKGESSRDVASTQSSKPEAKAALSQPKPAAKPMVRGNTKTESVDFIEEVSGDKLEGGIDDGKPIESSKPKTQPKRLVIYKALYSLIVDSVKDTVKLIEDLVKKYQGFIDKMSSSDAFRQAEVVIRVPVQNFEQAIAEVAKLGIVETKNISASDVTEEYYDTLLRLESAKKILTRMRELLKQVSKPEERIKILKEIERLSSDIEIMENRIKFLRSQADYSTITIKLKTRIREEQKRFNPSPFLWIRALNPDNAPGYKVDKNFTFKKPDGFFLRQNEYQARESNYLLVNPGNTAKIRLGIVENYPKADEKFWSEALLLDANNRKYEKVKAITIALDEISFSGYVYQISQDRYFLVAVSVKDEEIMITEGLFQDKKVYQENSAKLTAFLKSLRW